MNDGESSSQGDVTHTVVIELVDRAGFVLARVVRTRTGDANHKAAAANAVKDVLADMAEPWLACEVVDRHGKFSPGGVRSERIHGVRAVPE